MMGHPSSYFIRALVCEGKTDTDIVDEFDVSGMVLPSDANLRNARIMVDGFLDIGGLATADNTVRAWLRERGIYTYFQDRECFTRASKILSIGSARADVEKMLLAGAPLHETLSVLTEYPDFMHYTLRDLKTYKHYFWNVGLLSKDRMLMFLKKSDSSEYYIEALTFGVERLHQHKGKKTSISPSDLHKHIMMGVGTRASMLMKLPMTSESDDRVVRMAKAFSGMWKDSNTVGHGGMIEATNRLEAFNEKRNKPSVRNTGRGNEPEFQPQLPLSREELIALEQEEENQDE